MTRATNVFIYCVEKGIQRMFQAYLVRDASTRALLDLWRYSRTPFNKLQVRIWNSFSEWMFSVANMEQATLLWP